MLREILFANKGALTDDVKTLMIARKVNFGERELTGALPLRFRSDGTSLLDWSITGAAGGVGKLGKNYLKPRTTPIPNGCEGTWISSAFGYRDAEAGYTFNSGNATRIYITFKRPNDAGISAANTGNLMLVEGSTIPTTYDADTNLYKYGFLQGSSETHDGANNSGVSQIIFDNEDEYGRSNNYNNADGRNIRCKTYPIMLEPDTDYSIKLFNSSYSGVQFSAAFMTEPGTITPQFRSLSNQKSIPANDTFVSNTEQWIGLNYQYYRTKSWRPPVPVDVRPVRYEFCEYFADLKAGTYKLMIDIWGNNDMGSSVGFQSYTGCFEDNWNSEQSNLYEWFAVVDEDNNSVIPKTSIFESGDTRSSRSAPYPNYYHKEFTFTLSGNKKVGVIHKAYYTSVTYAYPPFFRFMIVDSDVEAEEFATTGVSPADMSGNSAWEKYSVSLPVNTSSRGQTQTVTVDLGDSFLGAGDTISLSDTHVSIPTYSGTNVITVDSEVQPSEMYINYVG